MTKIYFIDGDGKKVSIEVSDEIAQQYKESMREEWRNDAYEKYYSKSLDGIIEAGHDFEDTQMNTEEQFIEREKSRERQAMLKKLKTVLPCLTDLQRQTLHKLFVLNMSQAEVAREEGVAQQVVNKRVARIYAQTKKFLEKN